jgi:hypothetical protein
MGLLAALAIASSRPIVERFLGDDLAHRTAALVDATARRSPGTLLEEIDSPASCPMVVAPHASWRHGRASADSATGNC